MAIRVYCADVAQFRRAIVAATVSQPLRDRIGKGEVDNTLAAVRAMSAFGQELPALIDRLHPEQRPTILLHEGDAQRGIPTVWLLGWSTQESTGIHGHGPSRATIGVLRGAVTDIQYIPQVAGAQVRTYHAGSTVGIPHGYVHDVLGVTDDKDARDVTVHAYWPPLEEMEFFDAELHQVGEWKQGAREQRAEDIEGDCA